MCEKEKANMCIIGVSDSGYCELTLSRNISFKYRYRYIAMTLEFARANVPVKYIRGEYLKGE